MLVMQYPKCTTCKKALKWLDNHGITYESRDIKENNPTAEELKDWYQRSGMPLTKFFNTRGTLYREMHLKTKLPTMSEEDMIQLLATDGMLVKRPLVILDDQVLIGFNEKTWSETLL
ncbi:arsenate reductase [Intestinibaculum porci]|jgi:arsenate reductase|uniref:Arsenate reductase n=1 Tax=Intestinibaculum porci TaxID=2487118 RepID=A0A3G9JHA3_9FIRM|nr:arsenate reductase family protein [Intestinibaculum porci]BBH27725.1 arsenate reductase [Intestinibaculum porci]